MPVFAQNEILFSAISNTYIPLLDLFQKLKDEGLKFKISMCLSPILCYLLEDPEIQEQYIDFLDKKIALGESELERTKNSEELKNIVAVELEKNKKNRVSFVEKYGKKIVKEFAALEKCGYVELLATTATYAYLPHFSDKQQLVDAQIEAGIVSYKKTFGKQPMGFLLPENGYYPGLEKNLRNFGISYTVTSSASVLFSKNPPETGIFSPLRTTNLLGVFPLDDSINEFIGGCMENSYYKDVSDDIGFELPIENLRTIFSYGTPRFSTGYSYYSNGSGEEKSVYSVEKAVEMAEIDAKKFVEEKNVLLEKVSSIRAAENSQVENISKKNSDNICEKSENQNGPVSEENLCLTFEIEASKLGNEWEEGILWLENVIRLCSSKEYESLCISGLNDALGNVFSLKRFVPVASSSNGLGYGENLVDNSNDFIVRYVKKASDRMVDIVDRFPKETSLKARLLNLGAVELLLAQSAEWNLMLYNKIYPEYVKEQFALLIENFTKVFDALGSNEVSTEWMTSLEEQHKIFPWMNFHIFSKKN